MILVELPDNLPEPRRYAIDVVLRHMLGLSFRLEPKSSDRIRLLLDNRSVVEMPDTFFAGAAPNWLQAESLPKPPFSYWQASGQLGIDNLEPRELPVVFGDGDFARTQTADQSLLRLPIDVFGSAFFMLSRYEEAVLDIVDEHDRFPSGASVGALDGILDRPLVDEYVEVLWAAITELDPMLRRKNHVFSELWSCDVDTPFDAGIRTLGGALRQTAGDLLKRGNPRLALDRVRSAYRVRRHGVRADQMWQFEWMMDTCEAHNVQCAFNFLTASEHERDGTGYWGNPAIETLITTAHARGHEIGLHPSYTSFDSETQTRVEFDRLRATCERLGLDQARWGGRQHYLRWKAPITWRNWAAAGLDYDSTLGFVDRPGFRCGTCRRYPVFDTGHQTPLPLEERPLIVMDVALFDPYDSTAEDIENALAQMREFKRIVNRFGGDFTVLWHNSSLATAQQKQAYIGLLERP